MSNQSKKFTLASLFKNLKFQRNFVRRIPACLRIYEHYKAGYSQSAKFVDAFTLAEVLITLTIIGVVSALVIPSVLKNYNDKKYNTARLKALKTFGEAGRMASINDEMNSQANATDFVNNVLSKYLKITKVCTIANSTDCGFPSEIQPVNPAESKREIRYLNTWFYLGCYNNTIMGAPTHDSSMSKIISTVDGFSALIHYNPKCARNPQEIHLSSSCNYKECSYFNMDAVCMNVIYDMNGVKGPNHMGEDMGFVSVFWSGPKATAVAPGIIPYSVNSTGTVSATFAGAQRVCAQKSTNKVLYSMPTIDEISAINMNRTLLSYPADDHWSSTPVSDRPGYAWHAPNSGDRGHGQLEWVFRVWCVRH